ncbi:hypothetical protein DDW07_03100 [Acidilobus sp. SCGC AC-742_E15]|nr:hypothetical protein DDW07_03100 [Acidilobus sp. SCGC AC-742_E15]
MGKGHSCPHSDLTNFILTQAPSRLNPQAVSGHLYVALETRDQSALMRGLKEVLVLSVMKSSLHSDLGLLASQTFKSLKPFAL